MKFKKSAKPLETSDVYYDLFEGGYIRPDRMLVDLDEIMEVERAMLTIREFLSEAEEQGKIKFS